MPMNIDRQAETATRSRFSNKSARSRSVLCVILAGLALTLAACSSAGTAGSSAKAPSGSTSTGAAGTDSITIHNFTFSPDTITVSPGATVTVTNKDQVTHTLTATNGGFSTGDIASGQSKSFTAPKRAGTYSYICMIHQYMTGTLVVSG
jgi:plastocyanin